MPRPWTQWTDAAIAPRGDSREEWWIVNELLTRLGVSSPGDPWDVIRDIVADSPVARQHGLTIEEIARHPHGIAIGGDAPVGVAADRIGVYTQGRTTRVQLAAHDMLDELARLQDAPPPSGELLLVGRRDLRSMNSWLHNVRGGRAHPPTLYVNPVDAAARNLDDGDHAEVSTHAGSITVPVEVSDDVIPGVVCYPHGWGHQGGWHTAIAHGGANVNDIIPNDVERKERVSGMSFMDGIPVTVERARRDATAGEDPPLEHHQTSTPARVAVARRTDGEP
jgi:formate dehydrogenase